MITGYFMAPVRGEDGDNVTQKKKWENIEKALAVAEWLEKHFPNVDWYIPHRNESFIEMLMDTYGVTSNMIIHTFSLLAAQKDFGVAYDADCFSEGMAQEYSAMARARKPLMCFASTSDTAKQQISMIIAKIMESK